MISYRKNGLILNFESGFLLGFLKIGTSFGTFEKSKLKLCIFQNHQEKQKQENEIDFGFFCVT